MHSATRPRVVGAIAGGALLMLLSRPTLANHYVPEGASLGQPVMSATDGEDSWLIVQLLRDVDEPRTVMVMGSAMFLLSRYLRSRITKKPRFRTNRSAADSKAEIASLV